MAARKSVSTVGYGKAVKLVRAGHPEDAARQLQDIVQRKPSLLFPQIVLGQLLLQGSNPGEAVQPLESAAALDPNDVEIEHNLAIAYLAAGRPGDAREQIGKAFEAEKDSPASPLFIRGVAEGESSDFSHGIADLNAALQLYPQWTAAKEWLAGFQARQSGRSDLPPPVVPYSRLVMKSEEWPVFP